MSNHFEVDIQGQLGFNGNLGGMDGGHDDDGRGNNIDFKELQRLWETNLKNKVFEGKQRAFQRNNELIMKLEEPGSRMPYFTGMHGEDPMGQRPPYPFPPPMGNGPPPYGAPGMPPH